jgi:CCR4-NOT transcription complex subunit 2
MISNSRSLRLDSYTDNQQNQAQIQQMQQRQQTGTLPGDTQESSVASQSVEQLPLSQLSELDRFGLAGLLRMSHSENPDVASLAVGQDLMTLGLDLNQPEYESMMFLDCLFPY